MHFKHLLAIAAACSCLSSLVSGAEWTPNYSFLQPLKKKVEKILPNGGIEKVNNFLENIHVPGISLDVVVRLYYLK